jgi:NADPH:quinone reductase-like Zn-dependent oxidoreductase
MIKYSKIVVSKFGDVSTLHYEDANMSRPSKGSARIKVHAIGIGYTDIMARRGEYIWQRSTPFTPGYEFSGEVIDFNCHNQAQPEWLRPGKKVVVCLPKMGAYTELASVPIDLLAPLPDDFDLNIAAAMALNYLTALSMLEHHAKTRRGDTVLIQGAAGGVGEALCQLGKYMGLKMYGTASAHDFDKLELYGVIPIDYKNEDFEEVITKRELTGIQAVFDHLGGKNFRKGYRILAPGGAIVSYAFVGKPGHVLRDTILGAAQTMLFGLTPNKRTALCAIPKEIQANHHWCRESLIRLVGLAVQDKIRPSVGATWPLDKVTEAQTALEIHQVKGKIVLHTKWLADRSSTKLPL